MSQELPVVSTGTSQAWWGPISVVWALPDKRWTSQRQVSPEGHCAMSFSRDWALQACMSVCRRKLGREVRLIFARVNYENFGKCFKLSEPQPPRITVATCRVTVRMKGIPQAMYPSCHRVCVC